MIDLQYITNDKTGERRLYFRVLAGYLDASGAYNIGGQPSWGPWARVPEKDLDESTMDDLIESGGIFPESKEGAGGE